MLSVSFDFDNTLSRPEVQHYAAKLLARGLNVWVVTARYDENHKHRYRPSPTNEDLYAVVDRLGIPRTHIRFQNMRPKCEYLEGSLFVWHLDDDPVELSAIENTKGCAVVGVDSLHRNWRRTCEGLLEKITKSPQESPAPLSRGDVNKCINESMQ